LDGTLLLLLRLLFPLLLLLLLALLLLLPQCMCCCNSWPKGPIQGLLVQGSWLLLLLLLLLLVPLQDAGDQMRLCSLQQGLHTICSTLLLLLLLQHGLLLLCEAACVCKA
jgi:hypothetical protein